MKTFMLVVLSVLAAVFLIWLVVTAFAATDDGRSRMPPDIGYQLHDCGKAVDGPTGAPLVCCRVSLVREQTSRL